MFYFNEQPPLPQTPKAAREYARVLDFREELETKGIVGTYAGVRGNPKGFFETIGQHLRAEGPLDEGLRLIGFAVWERADGNRNVTFPARQYSVNGERRSFALLRPIADTPAQNRIRDLIIVAYQQFEAEASL